MKLFIISIPLLLMCITTNNLEYQQVDEKLFGVWIMTEQIENELTFKRSKLFDKNRGGLKFLRNGHLVFRQNVSWCATPPIEYKNYKGSWNISNGTKLSMGCAYWGGDSQQVWEIIILNESELRIKLKSFEGDQNF